MSKPTLGVCYYPEHWPEERWESDAARMAEVGITYVRIGEFAWSKLEPRPGELDFGWMVRAMDTLGRHGLKRGENGLRVIMMCEVPSNAVLAKEFLQYFDGFSIGSNDLTQLTLGLDRDSGLAAQAFDERDPAVKVLLAQAIAACRAEGKYVGICGQGPSDHPDLAQWLMEQGISSISLNPDTVIATWQQLAKH